MEASSVPPTTPLFRNDILSMVLHYIAYHLAARPDIQEAVHSEIDAVVGSTDEVTYEHTTRLPYTSAVIEETLRLFPNVRMNRECTRDVVLEGFGPRQEGLSVCAGDVVILPIKAIHYDKRHWGPEPERFDPSRYASYCLSVAACCECGGV